MGRKKKKQGPAFASTSGNSKEAKRKHRKKVKELNAAPPRTSGYDKKTGKQVSSANKIASDSTSETYQWIEDTGGKNVKVKQRKFLKDHAKPMREDEWASINGSTCKINRDKFDPNYEEIFGKKERGAASGKFKKFKKTY